MLDWWIDLKRQHLEKFEKKSEAVETPNAFAIYKMVYELDENILYNLIKIKSELTLNQN